MNVAHEVVGLQEVGIRPILRISKFQWYWNVLTPPLNVNLAPITYPLHITYLCLIVFILLFLADEAGGEEQAQEGLSKMEFILRSL